MKKTSIIFFAILFFVLVAGSAMAATEWHTANQTTVGWDMDYGNIAPAEVTFNIYVANALTDPSKSSPVKVGNVAEKQYTITLNTEGRYFVGVSATRNVDGVDLESDITWSDTSANPFGIQFFEVPKKPIGLILK